MNAPITPNDLLGMLAIMDEQTEDDRDEDLHEMCVTAWPTKEAQDQ